MTTIAWDGKTIATDTQATSTYIDQNTYDKIFTTKAGEIVACAGACSDIAAFRLWLENGDDDKDFPEGIKELHALLVDTSDASSGVSAYYYDNRPERFPVKAPCAVGSGQDFAMGALLMGASARQAVAVAIKLDPFTGGKIRSKRT